MCGFAGFVSVPFPGNAESLLQGMGNKIAHRGPDADGTWCYPDAGLGLVHRRLAIQDLSPLGAQPMHSGTDRYTIVFNGEIYNFLALRAELEKLGVTFRGHSDTEVMLEAFEAWGIPAALDRFNGMFAFALWDRDTQELTLARDRLGEKPLYYGTQAGSLVFGSELKALKVHPSWQGEIDRNAITLLLRHNLIPAPHTIYENVFKLPPASFITFSLPTSLAALPEPQRYWRLESAFGDSPGLAERQPLAAVADQLERCLSEVIAQQMISDVPLGAFLSGGIDSSTVVALMQRVGSEPVRSFSIGFEEPGFNEAEHAKAVAAHLGARHTEMYVSPDDALALIPRLPVLYDEPFADSSQLPTFLVSQMTRQHVTVALSGDGGDELFCGYPRYLSVASAWGRRGTFNSRARRLATAFPPALMAQLVTAMVPGQRGRASASVEERLRQERGSALAKNLAEFYRQKVSFWADPKRLVKGAREPDYALTLPVPESVAADPLKSLMWLDLNWYLPDDILVKVDRAAMACSLETRVPMLDRRVVEFALSIPTALNVENGQGKRVLREVLYRHVPRELVDRPKQGFAVPLGHWLRTVLRDWAEALLDAQRLEREGYLNAKPVRRLWDAHLRGVDDHAYSLWGVLMFQAWLEHENTEPAGYR